VINLPWFRCWRRQTQWPTAPSSRANCQLLKFPHCLSPIRRNQTQPHFPSQTPRILTSLQGLKSPPILQFWNRPLLKHRTASCEMIYFGQMAVSWTLCQTHRCSYRCGWLFAEPVVRTDSSKDGERGVWVWWAIWCPNLSNSFWAFGYHFRFRECRWDWNRRPTTSWHTRFTLSCGCFSTSWLIDCSRARSHSYCSISTTKPWDLLLRLSWYLWVLNQATCTHSPLFSEKQCPFPQ